MTTPEHQVARSGAELVLAKDGRWLVASDVSAPLIVFVHGFTTHGRYLQRLADYIGAQTYVSALFNYDSYLGIEQASNDLEYLLDDLNDVLTRHGFALIAHSMGGLVSRYFAEYSKCACRASLKGIVTLGTPHRGTISRALLNRMLDWADTVAGPNPFSRTLACAASRQLTDASGAGVIAQLNACSSSSAPPLLSISGGLPYLELGFGGGKGFVGALHNIFLQRLIGEQPNDGLVAESSSDITQVLTQASNRSHTRDYPAYRIINHTYLTHNQQVGKLLRSWLRVAFQSA